MKYMVMECHLSYAVVLDEDGRFLKVANRHYEVGQTVTDVIEMQSPDAVPQKKSMNRWMYSLAAMAACLMLMVTSVFQMGQMTYASVYMAINPEVRIDVNRKDVVVGLEGINDDGKHLMEEYSFKKKKLDLVMDELVDRAIDKGYLHEGGQISLTLDADSEEWIVSHGDSLTTHLNEYLSDSISVTIEVSDKKEENYQVIIPVESSDGNYGESDYGDENPQTEPPAASEPTYSNYGNSNYDDGQTDYGDQDTDADGQSEYDDDSDADDDGQSEYDDDSDADADGQSEYDDDSGADADGQSEYDVDIDTDDDGQTDYGNQDIPDDEGQSSYGPDDTDDDSQTDYTDRGGTDFDDIEAPQIEDSQSDYDWEDEEDSDDDD